MAILIGWREKIVGEEYMYYPHIYYGEEGDVYWYFVQTIISSYDLKPRIGLLRAKKNQLQVTKQEITQYQDIIDHLENNDESYQIDGRYQKLAMYIGVSANANREVLIGAYADMVTDTLYQLDKISKMIHVFEECSDIYSRVQETNDIDTLIQIQKDIESLKDIFSYEFSLKDMTSELLDFLYSSDMPYTIQTLNLDNKTEIEYGYLWVYTEGKVVKCEAFVGKNIADARNKFVLHLIKDIVSISKDIFISESISYTDMSEEDANRLWAWVEKIGIIYPKTAMTNTERIEKLREAYGEIENSSDRLKTELIKAYEVLSEYTEIYPLKPLKK